MWAINLSLAISKQCSNQWEIISANRWASLSISPSLYLSYLYPLLPPPPPSPHPFCLIFAVSLFFPPTPPFTCVPSSSLRSTLKCDSSAAPEPLTKVAFNQGICNIAGLTFLANIMSLTCSYNQKIPSLTEVTTRPTYSLLLLMLLLSSLVDRGQLLKILLFRHSSCKDLFLISGKNVLKNTQCTFHTCSTQQESICVGGIPTYWKYCVWFN